MGRVPRYVSEFMYSCKPCATLQEDVACAFDLSANLANVAKLAVILVENVADSLSLI